MTLTDIQSNQQLRHYEFPVSTRCTYLAHAGVCPLPRRVASALADYALATQHGDQEILAPDQLVPQTRNLAAKLIGVHPDEISFVGPTSLALSLVANGLPFKPGDNILIYPNDYPSNVYPWMMLAQRGIEVRHLKTHALGCIEPEDVLTQVDRRTKLVALASCHFVSGWRIDHDTIGRALRERGIWFCLDAIQTLGAAPLSGRYVDFLAADAHKWMLGPCSAGILYVRKEMKEILQPTAVGWNNALCPRFVAQNNIIFHHDGRRYEPGTMNLLGLVGLKAALELILEIGLENITAQLRKQRELLAEELQTRGFVVLHPDAPPTNTAGILSFCTVNSDIRMIYSNLLKGNITTSRRADRPGQFYVRVSP
ncbi:MAG: aminotransferase class V-fold PLP-dependent enzyme, partial [Verrucomicrobiae bacterium]|nr:aminotransferase class V-fold PLP-dependent enzyme [Verrucomicrobiae bacterium]